jgi:hypothetical protein
MQKFLLLAVVLAICASVSAFAPRFASRTVSTTLSMSGEGKFDIYNMLPSIALIFNLLISEKSFLSHRYRRNGQRAQSEDGCPYDGMQEGAY